MSSWRRNAQIYAPPTPVPLALDAARNLARSPRHQLIGESRDHLDVSGTCSPQGPSRVPGFDARIAAICLAHGVDALWSADGTSAGSRNCGC